MNTINKAIALGFLAAGLLGCAHTVSWTTGYESETYYYKIAWLNESTKEFLPQGWRIDNYYWDQGKGKFVEKRQGIYMANRSVDIDGDGEVSPSETKEEPLYDLHFVNEKDNGVIWAKAHPVLFRHKDKELAVLVENYIDSLAGRGLYKQGSLFGTAEVKTREFVTFVIEQKPFICDDHAAISIVVELAEAEKLKVDPSHRTDKVKAIFTHFEYYEKVSRREPNPGWQEFTAQKPRGGVDRLLKKKALLVLGYANSAQRFDQQVGDFDGMVRRVKLPLPPASPPPHLSTSSSPPSPPASTLPAAPSSSPPAAPSAAPPAPSASSAPPPSASAPVR